MLAPQNGAPSVAVPTHFAKVILASRSTPGAFWEKSSGREERGLEVIGNGEGREWSLGSFVLPNDVIPDQVRLETFLVPGTFLFPPPLLHVSSRKILIHDNL